MCPIHLRLRNFIHCKWVTHTQYCSIFFCFRRKKRDGDSQWVYRPHRAIAQRMTKMVFDNCLRGDPEDGGVTWEGIDAFLEEFVDRKYIKKYLEILKSQVSCPPQIRNRRQLLWRLWCRKPLPPKNPTKAYLGRVTLPIAYAKGELLSFWLTKIEDAAMAREDPYMDISKVFTATNNPSNCRTRNANSRLRDIKLEHGTVAGVKMENDRQEDSGADLVFPKSTHHDYLYVFKMLHGLSKAAQVVKCRCKLDLDKKLLFVDIDVTLENKGETLIQCAVERNSGENTVLDQIHLDRILKYIDHLKNTDIIEKDLEALNIEWDNACNDLDEQEIPLELAKPLSFNIFDSIMAGVEDLDRPYERSLHRFLKANIALNLKNYQKRALSFMYQEETASGGTARHLWLRWPLPGNQPGIEAWVSPSLFQIYISKSKTLANQKIGTTGGSGWQALEMGMGKTAVILAGTLLNPPPENWRAYRPWKPYDENDFYATYIENMPRGGTLVVAPTTLIHQWETEIEKTFVNPSSIRVLNWTHRDKTMNSKEIANYDLVLTTPQIATKTSVLTSIFWHRVVIDEAQLNAGSLMQSGTLVSNHRWIVTGTPCNETPASLSASLEFLRMGGYHVAQKYLPPVLATIFRAAMCRYTKSGKINDKTNLELPPLEEKVLPISMSERDRQYLHDFLCHNYESAIKLVRTAMKKGGHPTTSDVNDIIADSNAMNELVRSKLLKMIRLKKLMIEGRAAIGGGKRVLTGEIEFNEKNGRDEPVKELLYSKAQAIIEDTLALCRSDPKSKVLIFSEYGETLKTIAKALDDSGLLYQIIIATTSMKKRGEAIEVFNTDPSTRVFLLQAKSGSVGITLTAASHVYLCEPLLNPSLELQAIGRSRRMGQTRKVSVTRVYAQGTLEERLRDLLMHRRGGRQVFKSTAALAGEMEVNITASDIMKILQMEPSETGMTDSEDNME